MFRNRPDFMNTALLSVARCSALFLLVTIFSCTTPSAKISAPEESSQTNVNSPAPVAAKKSVAFDTKFFDQLNNRLANGDTSGRWPVKTAYPLPGAILPFKRVIAFYGNLYVKGMGILGELPKDEMLKKLKAECKQWQDADSLVKIQPALHYIAVTAQSSPGSKKLYRLQMPSHQIDTIVNMAKKIDAIVFLDVQVGHSVLSSEIPDLEKYLVLPEVHLGIDPEFSMKGGERPGAKVGTFDASDINYTIDYLASLVKKYNLPPKILVVHRFTQGMVTNSGKIKTVPEVQVVMHMDGFGFPAKKVDTYKRFISKQPVQFTGFKLFYKNDKQDPRWPVIMTPAEVLKLQPQPSYIQYQ